MYHLLMSKKKDIRFSWACPIHVGGSSNVLTGSLWPLQTLSLLASDVLIPWHAIRLHAIHIYKNQELEFRIVPGVDRLAMAAGSPWIFALLSSDSNPVFFVKWFERTWCSLHWIILSIT